MSNVSTCYRCSGRITATMRICPNCRAPLLIQERYRVISQLGSGGFGVVLKGHDLRLDRPCAIKAISHSRADQQEQIRLEVDILSKNARELHFIPDVYDFWSDNGQSYLVLEFVEGTTIDQARPLPWPAAEVELFLRELLANLHELHSRRIVHRDLKPQNIMRGPDGRYTLIDFGISKYGEATMRGAKAASFSFAPPEQFRGTTDGRSDLYSLGATTYLLLTGQLIPAAYTRTSGTPIVWPSQLGLALRPQLEQTLQAMLELDPARRPSDAREALGALEERARYLPPPVRPPPPARNRYLLPAGIAGGMAIGGLVLALVFGSLGASWSPEVPSAEVAGSAETQTALVVQSSATSAAPTRTAAATSTPRPPRPTATASAATAVAGSLATGDTAPDFTLRDAQGREVTLSEELRDHRSVVLVFYYNDT